ncbi:lamin tail domain-containing protein [Candidatus Woesearchaeota archaeon]|nr:lamin tail domain-containing protein [Candidatus Woesearchaeota archaeon]
MKIVKNGNILLILLIFILIFRTAEAEVFISSVYPNALGSESGGEAIELFNAGYGTINLSGWSIGTELSDRDVVFGDSHIIMNGSYFLIGDGGWSIHKDNISWPDADLEETIALYDTDSGIALYDQDGSLVDAVGWGDNDSIESGKFLGDPVDNPSEGEMIIRSFNEGYMNTGNNSNDFIISLPVWSIGLSQPVNDGEGDDNDGNVSIEEGSDNETDNDISVNETATGSSLNMSILVNNSIPFIEYIALEDDLDGERFDILPYPGINRSIEVTALVRDFNGPEDIKNVVIIEESDQQTEMALQYSVNLTHALWKGYIEIGYATPPGSYNLSVRANDSSSSESLDASYNILGVKAISADTRNLIFSVEPGVETIIRGDLNFSSVDAVTVRNIGNVECGIGLDASDFVLGSYRISHTNISYSLLDDDFENSHSGRFGNSIMSTNLTLDPRQSRELSLRIDAQYGIMSGNYSGQIVIYST